MWRFPESDIFDGRRLLGLRGRLRGRHAAQTSNVLLRCVFERSAPDLVNQEMQAFYCGWIILPLFVQAGNGRESLVGVAGCRRYQVSPLIFVDDSPVLRARSVRFGFFVESTFESLSGK